MPRVVHFEIPVDRPERAESFYSSVFGWQFRKWQGTDYWLIRTGAGEEPGVDGGMMRRTADLRCACTMVCVTSIESTLELVVAHGGRVTTPQTTIPGLGWLAYCEDTEGNTFGIIQPIGKRP